MKNANQIARSRGFTLVELIVVMGIIGVLTSVVFVGVKIARSRSRIAKAKSEMRLYGMAFQAYKTSNLFSSSSWPITTNDGSQCRTVAQKSVPSGLVSEEYWKNGTTTDFCYYKRVWQTDSDPKKTNLMSEYGLVWPGLNNKSTDIANLTNVKRNGNVILILQKPKIPLGVRAESGLFNRIQNLDRADKDMVIYLSAAE